MFYDALKNDHGFDIDPFKALVAPRPIAWVSSLSREGVANLAPFSYFNAFAQNPHYVAFGIGPVKDTLRNIEATREFAVSLVTFDLKDRMNATSAHVGPEVDEFELAGLGKALDGAVRRYNDAVGGLETRVLPQFDMSKMTRLAVGKNWRQATQDQQKQLVKEFQTLLVRSYSAAYSAYRHVKVDVRPLKTIDGDDVTVKTQILLPGGAPPVAVDYAMNVTPDGWKVYNVVVEGVSLVTTYRTEFGVQIEQGGIDGLIRNLQERNSKAAQPPAPLKK